MSSIKLEVCVCQVLPSEQPGALGTSPAAGNKVTVRKIPMIRCESLTVKREWNGLYQERAKEKVEQDSGDHIDWFG